MAKDKIYEKPNGILVVNGKEYVTSVDKIKKIDGIEHVDKTLYREFDEVDFKKNINIIVQYIEDSVDKSLILTELIASQPINLIRKMVKEIQKKEEPKIQKGCLGVKVGKAYMQLVE